MSTTLPDATGTAVAAGLDRRFYAFAIDRLLVWPAYVAVGWATQVAVDRWLVTAGAVAAVVLAAGLVTALMTGLAGVTPGKAAVGLRVVARSSGGPIGVGAAMLRQLVLGVAALPTFGIGVAMLAWTAVMDRSGLRRGWHDQISDAAVVDVRPPPVEHADEAPPPRRIVNLTAMRLMPVAPAPQPPAPVPAPTPVLEPYAAPVPQRGTPAPAAAAPATPASGTAALGARASQSPATVEQPGVRAPGASSARGTAAPSRPAASPAPAGPSAPASPPRHAMGQPAAYSPPPLPLARWRVTFDTGESFVVEGLALVGRKPEPRPGEQVAHLVSLPSSDMSLSKTHAQFQVVPDGTLVVMDRGSTNGSVLIRGGVTRELGARKPATLREGDRVRFGDREMLVARA